MKMTYLIIGILLIGLLLILGTGITPGAVLDGVTYRGEEAKTHSIVIRGETGTRRIIHTEYDHLRDMLGYDDQISRST